MTLNYYKSILNSRYLNAAKPLSLNHGYTRKLAKTEKMFSDIQVESTKLFFTNQFQKKIKIL